MISSTTSSKKNRNVCMYNRTKKKRLLKDRQCNERDNDMIIAIDALTSATITQTRKFYTYKKKYEKAKDKQIVHGDKLTSMQKEVDDAKSNFYDARAQFFKEKDIREELSEEVQYLARKNNTLRKEKQKEIDIRKSILDGIKQTWIDFGTEINLRKNDIDQEAVDYSNNGKDNDNIVDCDHMKILRRINSQEGESTHEIESSKIKELETMINQLSYELKRKDNHLNMILHHLNDSGGGERQSR